MSSNINLEPVRFISKYFFFKNKKKSQNSTSPTSSKHKKEQNPNPTHMKEFLDNFL